MTTPYRSPSQTLTLPLQSDPPWLLAATGALTITSVGAFALLFGSLHFPAWLGAFPGMTVTVFGGSGLAAWSRRHGGTLFLDVAVTRLSVRDPQTAHTVVDFTQAFGAVLLVDRARKRRVLSLGQRNEALLILESAWDGAAPSASWQSRTREVDLGGVAISSASVGAVALTQGSSLNPLLERLEGELTPELPWMQHTVASGDVLSVTPGVVQLGMKAVTRSGRPQSFAIQTKVGPVAAVGVVEPDGGMILVAAEDAPIAPEATPVDTVPDAYVTLSVYELLRTLAS